MSHLDIKRTRSKTMNLFHTLVSPLSRHVTEKNSSAIEQTRKLLSDIKSVKRFRGKESLSRTLQ